MLTRRVKELIFISEGQKIIYFIWLWSDFLMGTKNLQKFASLPTCGFTAQLVEASNWYLDSMSS